MMRSLAPLSITVLIVALAGCQTSPVQDSGQTSDNINHLAVIDTQLGAGYLRDGKTDLAYKRVQRALELAPDYAPAHNVMALVEERLDRPKEAESHFRRAIAISPSDSASHNNFGAFLCRQGRSAEAEKEFMKAVKNPLYQTPEAAYTNAGLCLLQVGQDRKAETYLRKALSIDPKVPAALLAMSEISLKTGRALSARGYLQRYQEVGKNTAQSLWLGIRIERSLGDRNAVSSYAMLLKANYPDSHETELLLQSETQ